MAKKNNLVGGAKAKISLILIAGMAAGWGISGYTVVLQNSVRKQNAMVEKARNLYRTSCIYGQLINIRKH